MSFRKMFVYISLVLVFSGFKALASADLSTDETLTVDGRDQQTLVDPTVDQIKEYLQWKHQQKSENSLFEDSSDNFRINDYDPSMGAGRLIIRVHKSSNPKKAEYLEVLQQQSEDPNDVIPVNLFQNQTTNKAYVSTAGTYGRKTYVTPNGSFGLDSMEKMHYSSKYNNAPMPWSIFFNGGIAIHGATPNEFARLGRKASHGCVRVHPTNAKLIYSYIKSIGSGNVIIQVQ